MGNKRGGEEKIHGLGSRRRDPEIAVEHEVSEFRYQ